MWPCARQKEASIVVDGENVVPQVHAVLDKMANSQIASGAGNGRGTRASASATSLTSALAAPISDR